MNGGGAEDSAEAESKIAEALSHPGSVLVDAMVESVYHPTESA
jgi:hypothetical protein